MSDQLESTSSHYQGPDSTVLPAPRGHRHRPPRPRAALVAAALVIVAAVAVIVVRGIDHGSGAGQAPQPAPSAAAGETPSALRAAVTEVLRRRAAAIVGHDTAALLATVDPANPAFRRSQAQMLRNLARVHLASWSYTLGHGQMRVPAARQRHYGAVTWAPRDAAVHYRIAGFDSAATNLPQYPTFVQRGGHWYLASLRDFARRGDVSATDLWDYAPVDVVHRSDVLALGPRSQLATMRSVAARLALAVPRVTAVWGTDWARRVIVQVPATQHEMGLITADRDDLDQIAALTSAEISTTPGRPAPVGDRVTINPANWGKLGAAGAQIVLTHELAHVATRADTGTQTPKWLSEGFADYIGFARSGLAVTVVAGELAADVRAGDSPRRLPTNADFRGSNSALSQAYEAGWLACRYIAETFGQRALVRFYRAVGTSHRGSAAAVSAALRQVLGLRTGQFVTLWRLYVHEQLAS